jgi:hypothetical protein
MGNILVIAQDVMRKSTQSVRNIHRDVIIGLLIKLVDPDQVCRAPYRGNQHTSDDIHGKIAVYFGKVLLKRRTEVAKRLLHLVDTWGKFRIRGKGDAIRSAASMNRRLSLPQRNASYIRVCESDPN